VHLTTRFVAGVAARDGAGAVAEALSSLGPEGWVLDRTLPPALYELCVERTAGSVLAIEGPCPSTKASLARLSSLDRDESKTAVTAAAETARRAEALGARYLIVALGTVGSLESEWPTLRRWYQRGELGRTRARQAETARESAGRPSVDAALRALEQLLSVTEDAGLVLLVENARRPVDVPSPKELDRILGELEGAPIAPLYDAPRTLLADDFGIWPSALVEAACASAPLVYVGDGCGPIAGLPPGRGVLDVAAQRARLSNTTEQAFAPWPGLTVPEISRALRAWQ